jgi:anti-sigma factor RsiW
MTSEQARAVFDAVIDGELDDDTRVEFEQALASDDTLRADYERHRSLFQRHSAWDNDASVNLLAGVQHKLRARSGGRFYRDRFSEQRHMRGLGVMVALSSVLLIAIALWFAYQSGVFIDQ